MPEPTPPAGAPVPFERALTLVGERLPARYVSRTRELAGIASRAVVVAAEVALPVLGRSVAVAVVAYAVERALRASLGTVVERLLAPMDRGGSTITKTDITEWIIIERIRRR